MQDSNPKALEKAGVSPAAYFNELLRHSFRIYIMDEQRQQLDVVPDIAYLMRNRPRGTSLLRVKDSLTRRGALPSTGKPGV